MKRPVLILGATSAIARATANALAEKGYSLYLASRDEQELGRIAQDLRVRYHTDVQTGFYDIDNLERNPLFFQQVLQRTGELEGVILAIGELGKQTAAIHDFNEAEKIIRRNYVGACAILTPCADYMEKLKKGFIVAITSVAGDRGRQSNYVYGSAKGGLTIFLQGLRNRLSASGVQVMTVKPGFVDTAMTFGLPGMFLVAQPSQVGNAIVRGIEKKKNEIYVPWFWSTIMGVIKCIPERLFKNMKL